MEILSSHLTLVIAESSWQNAQKIVLPHPHLFPKLLLPLIGGVYTPVLGRQGQAELEASLT